MPQTRRFRSLRPVTLFRRLARWPRARLIVSYVAIGALTDGVFQFANVARHTALRTVSGIAAVLAISILFAVVTWYRHEEVINAAILLAVAWSFGQVLGSWVAAPLLASRLGSGVWMFAFGGLFAIPVMMLVVIAAACILVAVGRRLRPYFAPGTVGEERANGDGAA